MQRTVPEIQRNDLVATDPAIVTQCTTGLAMSDEPQILQQAVSLKCCSQ